MDTQTIIIDKENIDEQAIARAGELIKRGGLVAFPTETVYGLGGNALDGKSAEKIYKAKGRPSDNPLIIHICDIDDLQYIVKSIPPEVYRLADSFWPGPLTLIMNKSSKVPMQTTGGLETVAVRMPSDSIALLLIKAAGGYVAAPSANISGRPSPTTSKHVIEDMQGRIDMIIDGGDADFGLESTILDLTGQVPVILRPGTVTLEMLLTVLEDVQLDSVLHTNYNKEPPKAPGMKYKHYAPKGEMHIVEGNRQAVIRYIHNKIEEEHSAKLGIICMEDTLKSYPQGVIIKSLGSRENENEIARNLYRVLREFDEEEVTLIYAESFDVNSGVGHAVMNRLLKAAAYHVVKV